MKLNSHIISHPQGSEAWAQHRAASLNASDLAAAMGLSKYQTRSELIERLATGITPEVDAMTQARFDKGHANEAAAEPKAAEVIGEELYPMVLAAEVPGLKRKMSGSFDGLTLMQDMSWENKSPNAALVQSVQAGVIPPEYRPQMEQGLMLSGAGKCLFTVSDGEVFVSAWYESDPDLRAKIIPTWQQIEADVAAYVPPSPSAVEKVVAEPVEALPAPVVQVTGQIALQDNFKVFETRLRDFLENKLIRKPTTDQDFADLDGQIKAMKSARESLKAAEAQMLAQVQPVDQAKKTKDMLDKLLQQNVKMAEDLLTAEKDRRKLEIVTAGAAALKAHIDGLNTRLGKPYMPAIPADFGGAVRGLKSLTSMEDKVSGELARAKIAAHEVADRIDANLKYLRENAKDYAALFPDTAQIVLKATDDLQALATSRIAQHQAAEQKRLDDERARIRAEEQAKAEKEAREKLAAEQAEAKRLADEQAARDAETARQAAAAAAPAPTPAPAPTVIGVIPAGTLVTQAVLNAAAAPAANVVPLSRPAAPQADTSPRIKLGDICASIAPLSITADGLAALGFKQEPSTGAAKLYKLTDLPEIYAAMVRHIEAVQAKAAA
jgi:predicted phage-related endonuclease